MPPPRAGPLGKSMALTFALKTELLNWCFTQYMLIFHMHPKSGYTRFTAAATISTDNAPRQSTRPPQPLKRCDSQHGSHGNPARNICTLGGNAPSVLSGVGPKRRMVGVPSAPDICPRPLSLATRLSRPSGPLPSEQAKERPPATAHAMRITFAFRPHETCHQLYRPIQHP